MMPSVTRQIQSLPILPLRDVVVYPHMVIPLFVGRQKSIQALEHAMNHNISILLVAQKQGQTDNPEQEDIFDVGTISTILQLLKLPDSTVKVLVEGNLRGRTLKFIENPNFFEGQIETLEPAIPTGKVFEGLVRSLFSQFEQYIHLNKKVSPEILHSLVGISDPGRLMDTIAAHIPLKIEQKQRILGTVNLESRIQVLMSILESEIELLQVESRVRENIKKSMKDSQKEYYLNEQLKAIHKELGALTEGAVNELEQLTEKIEKTGMHAEAKEKTLNEVKKLKMMPPMSAEATVSRNYIDCMLSMPWKKRSKIRRDLLAAEAILEEEHFGLEKVKERILEYLAVQNRVKKLKGPILCLVGPPGVGKTSLGRSIAHATARKYVRMALGGVRDEAEIRGHRRTYIGAMPGKILQKLIKAEVNNPLFLLDEVDKMAQDYRGDPASALLEVLDPEQNQHFNDHYLEVDYDLSDVMFVATANSLDIPPALLDRMEVIQLSGYTEDEKLNIARSYLILKQIQRNGLEKSEIEISDEAIIDIIRYYTLEAGVRNLDRKIAKICRKVVKKILKKEIESPVKITRETLSEYLGVRQYRFGVAEQKDQIGQVTGLAWTQVGGDILTLEAVGMPGSGKILRTGKLGNVMQESIEAAITVVRARAEKLGLKKDFYEKIDIHVHVPEGATPKDGPSAGIGMATAVMSMLTKIPVKKEIAMTGEITLRGEVLPIGGLKEKLLAARRAGIQTVIIPKENEKDLQEIPESVYGNIQIQPVRWIDEVWQISLTQPLKSL